MAATNYTPIQLYYSTTASAAPTSGNLANGELAINITDGKLYYKDNGGVVQVIATKGAGTIGGSTTQIQYNNAGVLAGNAAMTFNNSTNVTTLTTLNLTNALGATYGGTAQSAYTQGDILYASATNTLSKLGVGTVNYILTSSGSVPQWAAPSSITVNTATNLAGGAGGSVPYQSAADTTTFLAIGAANRVMTSTGSAPQWVTALTGLTGVSSSSITNTSLTSGRLVYSTTGGAQTDSSSLTFNGTTLSAGGFSTTGLSTLVKTVTIGDSNFSGTAVFAAATPAKLYIGTGTVTDTTSAIGATNATGAISSLAITPIAATNTSVTYTNAATLYIAGAPSAGTNITLTNPYALYVNGGASYFGGAVDFAVTPSYSGGTANGVMYLNGSKQITTGTVLSFDGTNFVNRNTVSLYNRVQKTGTAYWEDGVDSIAYAATDSAMTFRVGGNVIANELMRLNTTGLGIFTNNPAAPLDVFSNAVATTPAARFYVNKNGVAPGSLQGFAIYNNVSGGFVDTTLVAGNTANTYMAFGIHNGTSYAEGMRLTSGDGLIITKNIFAGSGATSTSYTRLWNASGYTYFGVENASGGGLATGTSAYSAVIVSAGSQSIQFAPGGTVRANMFPSGDFTVGGTTAPGGRLSVVTTEAKTSAATPMCFATSTGGSNDFQLLIARSAAGSGAFYSLQVVEQGLGYRDLALQKDGGNVGISTTIPGYSLQIGSLGTGLQRTMYIPAYFNWDGFYAQVGTSAGRGAAAIFASHTNTTQSTAYKFLADNDSVARQLQLQYAADATSLSAASFSTKFWFDGASAQAAIGIGKAPSSALDVVGTINGTGLQMLGTGADFVVRRVEASAYPVAQLLQKSRGTPSSPTTVLNGDGIGILYFQPYVSSGYIFPAQIQAYVNGSVTSSSAPTDIVIATGSASATETIRMTSGNFVGIRASAPTNMLDVSGTIGKDYTSNVTVAANNTATIVVDAFNGQNFSAWIQAQFYGVGNNRWSGIISIDWDTGGSASCAMFSISKHSGFNGVNITQLSATNYNGATTTDGSYIYLRNAGGSSITPVFTFILLASS